MHLPEAHHFDDFQSQSIDKEPFTYNLLSSIIVPRPVAFVTTLGTNGVVNAAPFSFFNAVSTHPPIISIAIKQRTAQRKDTARNIIATKEFVVNICSIEIAKAISVASGEYPPDLSEIELTKLSLIPSKKISVPRVANTLVQMECILDQVVEIGIDPVDLILGEVVAIHIHKDILNSQGHVDVEKLNPLARLAGSTYAKIHDFFDIKRGL